MKTTVILSLLMLFISINIIAQQIPNGEFENWSGSPLKPVSWDASNESVYGTAFNTVTKDQTTPFSGTTAVKIETLTKTVLLVQQVTLPGLITLGEFTLDVANETATVEGGIPFPYRPAKLKGWYKSQPASGDQCVLGLGLSKLYGSVRDTIGYGEKLFSTTVTTWTPFEVDIEWTNSDIPDSLNIIASSSDLFAETFVTGSKLWLDKLYFAYPYLIQETQSVCEGTTVNWHGQALFQTGTYYDSLISSEGTDSVFVLNITFDPLPSVFDVTGGGSYNQGGAGLPVGLAGSESGVVYTLLFDGIQVTTLTGDGNALDFGNQTGEGTYTVTAVGLNGCAADMNGNAVVAVIVNINADNLSNLSVFPNPADNELFIETDKEIISAQLTDINGKVVWEGQNIKVDVSLFAKGNYILSVLTKTGRTDFPVILK